MLSNIKNQIHVFFQAVYKLFLSMLLLFMVIAIIKFFWAEHVFKEVELCYHLKIGGLSSYDIKQYSQTFEKLDKINSLLAVAMQKEMIQDYYNYAISHDAYKEVCKCIKPYLDHDFVKETYDQLQQEGEKYTNYRLALSLFYESRETQDFTDAFAVLNTLPEDYRDVPWIYESYEKVKDFPYSGTYVSNFSNQNYQKSFVGLCTDVEDGHRQFFLFVLVTWYEKGKDVEHYYTIIFPNRQDGNVLSVHNSTWTFNEDGTLTVESGTETTTFYPESYKDKKNAGSNNPSNPLLGLLKPAKPAPSTSKPYSSSNWSSHSNPYDVYDFDDPDDFADEWEDEFDSWDDAFMYWEDHND